MNDLKELLEKKCKEKRIEDKKKKDKKKKDNEEPIEEGRKTKGSKLIYTSNVVAGGNFLFPETITINTLQGTIIWRKRKNLWLYKDTIEIYICDINNIKLDFSLIGTTITITAKGSEPIVANGFVKSTALEIKQKLKQLKKKYNQFKDTF